MTAPSTAPAQAPSSTFVTALAGDWLAALALIEPITKSGSGFGALAGVVVEVKPDGFVELSATSYESAVVVPLGSVLAGGAPARWLVSARVLADTIKVVAMRSKVAPVRLSRIEYADRDVTLVESEGFVVPVDNLKLEEHPPILSLPRPLSLTISGRVLRDAVERTIIASSRDDTLPVLNSVLFDASGAGLTLHSTDRYRVVYARVPADVRQGARFVLPMMLLRQYAKSMSAGAKVRIVADDSTVKFIFERFTLIAKTTPGDYPKLGSLIAPEYPNTVTFDRVKFARSAKVARAFSEQWSSAHVAVTPFGVSVTSTLDGDDFTRSLVKAPMLPAAYSGPGAIGDYFFSPVYLLDAMKVLEADTVTMSFGDRHKPFAFTNGRGSAGAGAGPNMLYLLMPTRTPDQAGYRADGAER